MNPTKIAAALRLLADAIEAPASAESAPAAPATAPTASPASTAKRGPGRPPKTEASQGGGTPGTTTAPATTTAAPAASAPTTATAPAATTPSTPSGLTHAVVAQDFKNAAAKHGRDFVVGLMKAHNAATFDKVPVAALPAFQAALKAGPQAPAAGPADDLLG